MATVLLTTDGSDLALAAMARGVELLGKGHTYLALAVVPHAFVPAASVSPMDTHPTVVDALLEQEIEEEERVESTAELLALDGVLGVTTQHLVETGDAGPVICDVAARVGADIVVIGSHGHGLFQRMLIGSVSNHVTHHAPCPVLVIRLEDTDQK